jgi:hypothetical protein
MADIYSPLLLCLGCGLRALGDTMAVIYSMWASCVRSNCALSSHTYVGVERKIRWLSAKPLTCTSPTKTVSVSLHFLNPSTLTANLGP